MRASITYQRAGGAERHSAASDMPHFHGVERHTA
jgi:hypothetical protein